MRNNLRAILPILALLCAGCSKSNLETIFSSQDEKIEAFITKEQERVPGSVIIHDEGITRMIIKEGSGEPLDDGGTVSFYYAGYEFNGSISNDKMFATNHEETAKACKWELSGEGRYDIITTTLEEASFVEGLERGLRKVRGGEECYIVFSGRYGFGSKKYGTIPANSALLYHIWVESISND